jgi:hypothetical protein
MTRLRGAQQTRRREKFQVRGAAVAAQAEQAVQNWSQPKDPLPAGCFRWRVTVTVVNVLVAASRSVGWESRFRRIAAEK